MRIASVQQLSFVCHAPIPGQTRLADLNRFRGAKPYTGTLYIFILFLFFFIYFFFKAELIPVGIQTIFVIIYIYKGTTTGVVFIKIYTHILSPIYLYKHLYIYICLIQTSEIAENSVGEHLSLRWPVLLVWNVLSSLSPLQYLHGLNTRAKLYA